VDWVLYRVWVGSSRAFFFCFRLIVGLSSRELSSLSPTNIKLVSISGPLPTVPHLPLLSLHHFFHWALHRVLMGTFYVRYLSFDVFVYRQAHEEHFGTLLFFERSRSIDTPLSNLVGSSAPPRSFFIPSPIRATPSFSDSSVTIL
jgi:hypothetical protein